MGHPYSICPYLYIIGTLLPLGLSSALLTAQLLPGPASPFKAM